MEIVKLCPQHTDMPAILVSGKETSARRHQPSVPSRGPPFHRLGHRIHEENELTMATTTTNRTLTRTEAPVRALAWVTAFTGLLSIAAVTALALTGHPEEAAAAGLIGGAVSVTGGIRVTVIVRR